jgi:hypothetical protein
MKNKLARFDKQNKIQCPAKLSSLLSRIGAMTICLLASWQNEFGPKDLSMQYGFKHSKLIHHVFTTILCRLVFLLWHCAYLSKCLSAKCFLTKRLGTFAKSYNNYK